MVEISPLVASDRVEWETLTRAFKDHFNAPEPDDAYDRVWGRLLAATEIHGIAARIDGRMVGIAHYYFHVGVWRSTALYLADLFVDKDIRRHGVGRQLLDWLARHAADQGAGRFYWNTPESDPISRPFYDKVSKYVEMVMYSYPVKREPAIDEGRGPRR
ncbi:GNAT family N-acetyltransferase [Kutzneria buriramensis]|uniref:Acetyltransferase (GNAT) family protein n=1 Tax=Kutzneria buriramensis TaxID=1045776 RepID=A0A3E0HZR4_9PSEU|nr:GNAT family N-acetyltransferase [Kutzneria buriramensis]REH51810.1 acetyltransferase (GNAT) family protein [Kutzneria buriramensis]